MSGSNRIALILISWTVFALKHQSARADSCKELWYNHCVQDTDCCSAFCDRPVDFRYGVCKPNTSATNENGDRCHDIDYNRCKVDAHCCSQFCDKPESWEHGVCKAAADRHKCRPLFYNECKQHDDCCSKYCDKGPSGDWKYGVCKDEPVQDKKEEKRLAPSKCGPLGHNGCRRDEDCCTGFCDRGDTQGVCKYPEDEKAKLALLLKLFAKVYESTSTTTSTTTTTTTTQSPIMEKNQANPDEEYEEEYEDDDEGVSVDRGGSKPQIETSSLRIKTSGYDSPRSTSSSSSSSRQSNDRVSKQRRYQWPPM